jgi:hypothetical protein
MKDVLAQITPAAFMRILRCDGLWVIFSSSPIESFKKPTKVAAGLDIAGAKDSLRMRQSR